MQKVRFGVWFHGNEDEPEGICYAARNPYFVDNESTADAYMKELQACVDDPDKFSVCTIIISGKQ